MVAGFGCPEHDRKRRLVVPSAESQLGNHLQRIYNLNIRSPLMFAVPLRHQSTVHSPGVLFLLGTDREPNSLGDLLQE